MTRPLPQSSSACKSVGYAGAALVAAALSLGMGACGDAGGITRDIHVNERAGQAGSNDRPSDYSTRNNDRDNDGDHNDDDAHTLYFGHAADRADEQALSALAARYFAAAAREDGEAGCRLLAPFVAESLPEENGHWPTVRGSTCGAVLSKLFDLHHPLLAAKHATLRVTGVRVQGDRALVILDFPTIPEARQLIARRFGSRWSLLQALDGIIE